MGPRYLNKLNHITQGCFLQSFVEIGPMVLEKNMFHLPLEKSKARHLNKLEAPSAKDALHQVWLKFAKWFWNNFLFKFR